MHQNEESGHPRHRAYTNIGQKCSHVQHHAPTQNGPTHVRMRVLRIAFETLLQRDHDSQPAPRPTSQAPMSRLCRE
jgi:hypothetical protein